MNHGNFTTERTYKLEFIVVEIPPCGAGYFARGGKVTKAPPGLTQSDYGGEAALSSMGLTLDPITGDGLLNSIEALSASETRMVSAIAPGLRP